MLRCSSGGCRHGRRRGVGGSDLGLLGPDLGSWAGIRNAWRFPGVGDDRCVCPGAIGGDRGVASLAGLEEEEGLLLFAMWGVGVLQLCEYNKETLR
jgi:hypothetical protein